jgi:hypothetical protein
VQALNLGILARRSHDQGAGVAATFLRWTCMRAVFHRGYVLTSGLYFVVSARLSASQIVFLGAAMSVTLTLSDIPAGAWSDAVSRKWPLVAGHGFLAVGMVLTGIVTAFPLILCTQVLWGLGWAFSGGADVAWLTDELGQPGRIARVLAARARWDLAGGAAGLIAFGLLGSAAGLTVAIVVSGAAMALLGAFVATRFTEDNFAPVPGHRWAASLSAFRRGLAIARQDHEILLVLAATMAINGAGMIGWLFPRRLVGLGLPGGPVLGYTVVTILSSVAGIIALRSAEAWIDRAGAARRIYALACFTGMVGLFVLARAPDALIGGIGVLLASGIGFNVTRAVSVIWVNRRTTSEVRATVHSVLSQAETVGEIVGGITLAAVAQTAGLSVALMSSGAFIACLGVMVAGIIRSSRPRVP